MRDRDEDTFEELEDLLKNSDLPWWEWHVKENIVKSNDLKPKILGYDPEDFKNVGHEAYTDLLHPEDYDRTIQAMRDYLEGKKQLYQIDYRIKKANGEYTWFMDRGLITKRDSEGEPAVVRGLVIDLGDEIDDVDKGSVLFQKIRDSLPQNFGDFPVICSSCKQLKVEKDTWKEVTVELREVFQRDISHGICPDCIKKLYPKYAEKVLNKD